ncbi:MAG: pyruvate formate lyase-activating protein, partial [Dehalococcoidia bacterium]|nr:pyruvate formate lyase-activating protein [Dehalococcoidia bacterium]
MRILAIDVGTGTQDILLFDSSEVVENCPKLVMPSATSAIAKRIEAATAAGEALLLTGVTMGGGPCGWAAERHLKAGLPIYATPDAARTFDDHLENVSAMGAEVVSDDEAATLRNVTPIRMQDVDRAAVTTALRAFGVDDAWDAMAIAV